MKTVASRLVILACAFGVFVLIALILREDVPMPDWIPFDLHKSVWLAPVLKLFGVLLLASPFAGVIAAFIVLGSDPEGREPATTDAAGRFELRLAPGAKYTAVGFTLIVLGMLLFALIWKEEPLGIWLFVSPLILAFLYGLVLCFAVRARYDDDRVASLYYSLRWREHRWDDLTGIEFDGGAGDVILRFGDKGNQRLSAYYSGIGHLIEFAHSVLQQRDRVQSPWG